MLVDLLNQGRNSDVVDLAASQITYYDYNHQNCDDRFVAIVNQMLAADTLVFSTPVYWYAMSAQMKTFFDRTSDLLNLRKSMGRALKGRRTFLVTTGTDVKLPEGFEVPFRGTSEYFDMNYEGCLYARITADLSLSLEVRTEAASFASKIFAA